MASSIDDDFADYATPSAEAAPSISTPSPFSPPTSSNAPVFRGPWYAVWERHSLSEFQTEGWILGLIGIVLIFHVIGTRRNRSFARNFIKSISPVLTKEFALVGFGTSVPNTLSRTSGGTDLGSGPEAESHPELDLDVALKEISNVEFQSYATGRNNIAFMHTTVKLQQRSNPIAVSIEWILSFFFDSIPAPADRVTITISPFDGSELGKSNHASKYDNFIWAVVNKRGMKRWRSERYDLSLTRTSDWEGLPNWCAVMGESKEIGDLCLVEDLRSAVVNAENFFEYLVVTDMPREKPTKIEELTPKKRVTLELTLPSPDEAEAVRNLIQAFVRLLDHLAAKAQFRPEVHRKLKTVREEEMRRLKRQIEEETKEEREEKRAAEKKEERERKLRNMTAEQQKKFLEKEREKERKGALKKGMKKA